MTNEKCNMANEKGNRREISANCSVKSTEQIAKAASPVLRHW
jgi:hypothetical protein